MHKQRNQDGSTPIPFLLKQVPFVFLSNLQNYNSNGRETDSRNSIDMMASLVAPTVTPAMLEIWVRSQAWEDPLEEGMATDSSILVWEIPWTERSLVGYSSWGLKELDMTE